MAPHWNLAAAWIAILLGMISGATLGLGFAREAFLGGYASWPRRLLRLGHVSFFGLALLNIAHALTARALGPDQGLELAGPLLIFATVAMPTACAIAATNRRRTWVFAPPVLAMCAAASLTAWACAHAILGGAS